MPASVGHRQVAQILSFCQITVSAQNDIERSAWRVLQRFCYYVQASQTLPPPAVLSDPKWPSILSRMSDTEQLGKGRHHGCPQRSVYAVSKPIIEYMGGTPDIV